MHLSQPAPGFPGLGRWSFSFPAYIYRNKPVALRLGRATAFTTVGFIAVCRHVRVLFLEIYVGLQYRRGDRARLRTRPLAEFRKRLSASRRNLQGYPRRESS